MLTLSDSSILSPQNGTLGVVLHKASLKDEAEGQARDRAKLNLFCQVYVGSQTQKTNSDSKHDLEPIWNEYLLFKRERETQVIIEIRNHNILFISKHIGECVIDLDEVLLKKNVFLKQDIRDGENVVGVLELALKWELPSSGPVIQKQTSIKNTPSFLRQPEVKEFFQQSESEPIVVLKPGQAPKFVAVQSLDTISSNGRVNSSRVAEELEDEPCNLDLPVEKRCVVCSKRARAGVFYRCGHNCCCNTCGRGLIGSPCPVCNKHIDDFVKVYRT